jgi:hypothetical protein
MQYFHFKNNQQKEPNLVKQALKVIVWFWVLRLNLSTAYFPKLNSALDLRENFLTQVHFFYSKSGIENSQGRFLRTECGPGTQIGQYLANHHG